jgi:hypothetical protein
MFCGKNGFRQQNNRYLLSTEEVHLFTVQYFKTLEYP